MTLPEIEINISKISSSSASLIDATVTSLLFSWYAVLLS